MARIRVQEGELGEAPVDAVVSTALPDLTPADATAAALRRTAGPELEEACRSLGPARPGDVVVTPAGELAARYVLHAVLETEGPLDEETLRVTVRSSLAAARSRGLRSLAFPALGGGARATGMQRRAEILLEEVRAPGVSDALEEICFVIEGEPSYRVFEQVHDAERIRAGLRKLAR
ncbi:MAG: macro domain-containing protein [Myxococcota bacterium]